MSTFFNSLSVIIINIEFDAIVLALSTMIAI